MDLPHAALLRENPAASGGSTGGDWWAWFLSAVFVDGKARAIFSMLFGAGVILMTEHAESAAAGTGSRVADIYYRRMLWLMAFGLVNSYLLVWPGDIIWLYGLCGLLLFPLRRLSARSLGGTGLGLIAIGVCVGIVEHSQLLDLRKKAFAVRAAQTSGAVVSSDQQQILDEWDDEIGWKRPLSREATEEALGSGRSGYVQNLVDAAPLTREFQSTPLYLETDLIGMMLIGMGLVRAGVISGTRRRRYYFASALAAIPLGTGLALLAPLSWSRSGFNAEHIVPWWGATAWTYPTQRLLLAIGYISVVILLVRTAAPRALWRSLATAGRMPLTNYLSLSVTYLVLFTGVGFALYGHFSRQQLIIVALAIWLTQVLLNRVWARYFVLGPMEFLWRWLSYGARPAMRR